MTGGAPIAWLWLAALAGPTPLVPVPGGTYTPLYAPEPGVTTVRVGAFRMEQHPVTVAQFRAFVVQAPTWRRDAAPTVLVGRAYLASWRDAVTPTAADDQPITEVSWFAARAYCASLGRRLPTEDEWELVGRASTTERDASADEGWLKEILAWYAQPSTSPIGLVGQRPANAWGVQDMHGLVWEWVEDYNNTLVASDARESGDDDRLRFCGAGAVSAQDVRDYANFMRVAWRSSLEGRTTTRNLGFRCAADPE